MKIKAILAVSLIAILALVGLAGCSAAGVTAAEVQPVNVDINSQQGIWVNGQGKITITPDLATLSLGVSAQTTTVAEAQSRASAAMDKVMAALISSGISNNDIQTQYFNIQQVTRWNDADQQEVVTGYRVSNMVVARIRAMDKVGNIIDAVVAAGGDFIRINGINFTVEKPEQFYAQARELAMKDAKAKADELARLAGVTLGKATFVSEGSSQSIPYLRESYGSGMPVPAMTVAAPSISPGSTDIILNVQVAYGIQ
jgi:uncharacterized protein YggE